MLDTVAADTGKLQLAVERWVSVEGELCRLGLEGFREVNGGLVAERPYKPDTATAAAMCALGLLCIVTARRFGALEGWAVWVLGPDVESKGVRVASQVTWYVVPWARRATAHRLWQRSVEELRGRGAQLMLPHVRLQGRGKGMGRFLQRKGAKPLAQSYCLWIGD